MRRSHNRCRRLQTNAGSVLIAASSEGLGVSMVFGEVSDRHSRESVITIINTIFIQQSIDFKKFSF